MAWFRYAVVGKRLPPGNAGKIDLVFLSINQSVSFTLDSVFWFHAEKLYVAILSLAASCSKSYCHMDRA